METAVIAAIVAILSFASGVATSHASLGKQVTRALTLLEQLPELSRQVADLASRVTAIDGGRLHVHRRRDDPNEE